MPSMSLIWAIATNADCFYLSNHDLSQSLNLGNTQIISVSQFLQLLEENGEGEE
jgi:hypothetical protein